MDELDLWKVLHELQARIRRHERMLRSVFTVLSSEQRARALKLAGAMNYADLQKSARDELAASDFESGELHLGSFRALDESADQAERLVLLEILMYSDVPGDKTAALRSWIETATPEELAADFAELLQRGPQGSSKSSVRGADAKSDKPKAARKGAAKKPAEKKAPKKKGGA